MTPPDLLLPDTRDEATPFSVRLAERLRQNKPRVNDVSHTAAAATSRSERRAHVRRPASDLEWLQAVRLTGGTGCGASLVDLSEGGALLEVDAPLRPGVALILEISGGEVEIAVPVEVLRCYIAALRGGVAVYRSAVSFTHLIELPGERVSRAAAAPAPAPAPAPPPAPAAGFVGMDAALGHLLRRFDVSLDSSRAGEPAVGLQRADVLRVLDALRDRESAAKQDPEHRYAAELLSAILPSLHKGASREVVLNALDRRLRVVPDRWQLRLAHTRQRLVALVERCAPADSGGDDGLETPLAAAAPR